MLQIRNQTPFIAALGVFANRDGIDCVYAVVKATFHTENGQVIPSDDQLPVVPVDEYWDDPDSSSLKQACEMTLMKPATDVLMTGHAYAPGQGAPQSAVRLRVGPVEKTVWVYGSRLWLPGVTGFSLSEAKPFQKIPLQYEYAFGGVDVAPIDDKRPDYEPRNPVGRGLIPMRSHRSAKSMLLPNLEDPKHLMQSPLDRPAPACFAPVAPHWEPRRSFAGTYDENWAANRAPFLPLDFDERFLQCAPPGLVANGYLSGNEPVEIVGATPQAPWRFSLPGCTMNMTFAHDRRTIERTPVLDTLHFEPDHKRFTMIWRTSLPVDKRLAQMKEVVVECAEFPKRSAA